MALFGFGIKDDEAKIKAQRELMYRNKQIKQLEDYSQLIEKYQNQLTKFEDVLLEYDAKCHDTQLDQVQIALDLKYLKEQGEQIQDQLGVISSTNLYDVEKQLKEYQTKIQDTLTRLEANISENGDLKKKVRGIKRINILILIVLFANLVGTAFLILSNLGYI